MGYNGYTGVGGKGDPARRRSDVAGTCKINAKHCEHCGNTDPSDLANSYSGCCNELIAWGADDCRDHHGFDDRERNDA